MARIRLSEIRLRKDARTVNAAAVKALSESLSEVGLLSPVHVRKKEDGYELCAGNHRYEAAASLGWEEIEAIVDDFDDLDAELVMIDENLCRAELSAADRARYTARRKAIYLEKHPETARGVAGAVAKHGRATENLSFAAETAKKTGQTERVVQLHAERGEKVAADVLRKIKGTHLDNGVYLDAMKKLPHDEQRVKVERDIKADVKRRERRKAAPKIISAPDQLDDDDVEEKQFSALMSAWNRASPSVRQRFREAIDTPVMDAGEIPSFLRRHA